MNKITAPEPSVNEALERADKLINWMAKYIGNMAPGSYHDCYADLNAHGVFMAQFRKASKNA